MTGRKDLNMNFLATQVAEKLKRNFPFHTALSWALSFPPYAGNFTHDEAAAIVGKILNERKQKKRCAKSKKEAAAKNTNTRCAHTPQNLSLLSELNYPD